MLKKVLVSLLSSLILFLFFDWFFGLVVESIELRDQRIAELEKLVALQDVQLGQAAKLEQLLREDKERCETLATLLEKSSSLLEAKTTFLEEGVSILEQGIALANGRAQLAEGWAHVLEAQLGVCQTELIETLKEEVEVPPPVQEFPSAPTTCLEERDLAVLEENLLRLEAELEVCEAGEGRRKRWWRR